MSSFWEEHKQKMQCIPPAQCFHHNEGVSLQRLYLADIDALAFTYSPDLSERELVRGDGHKAGGKPAGVQLGLVAQHVSGGLTGDPDEGDLLDGGRSVVLGPTAYLVPHILRDFPVLVVAGQRGEHLLSAEPKRPPAQDRLPAKLETTHSTSLQEPRKRQQAEERRKIVLQEHDFAGRLHDHPAPARVGQGRAWRYREHPLLELMPAFKELVSTMTNWQQEIFAYFDHQVTNAYTEALNGLIKVSNRVGRGYSFEVIRAKMLYDGGLVGERRYFNFRNHFSSYAMPLSPQSQIEQAPSGVVLRLVGRELSTLTDQIVQGTLWSDSTNSSE